MILSMLVSEDLDQKLVMVRLTKYTSATMVDDTLNAIIDDGGRL